MFEDIVSRSPIGQKNEEDYGGLLQSQTIYTPHIEVFTTVPLVAQLLGGPPAVDDQLRAGNERRFIRG